MDRCYCDYDLPSLYRTVRVKATRVKHRCHECGAVIPAKSSCEYVVGLWDGEFSHFRTCQLCLNLREWATISFPCLCLSHGSLLEEVYDRVCEAAPSVPGLFMEYGRLRVKIRRGRLPRKGL
jgi:hypothetical protein